MSTNTASTNSNTRRSYEPDDSPTRSMRVTRTASIPQLQTQPQEPPSYSQDPQPYSQPQQHTFPRPIQRVPPPPLMTPELRYLDSREEALRDEKRLNDLRDEKRLPENFDFPTPRDEKRLSDISLRNNPSSNPRDSPTANLSLRDEWKVTDKLLAEIDRAAQLQGQATQNQVPVRPQLQPQSSQIQVKTQSPPQSQSQATGQSPLKTQLQSQPQLHSQPQAPQTQPPLVQIPKGPVIERERERERERDGSGGSPHRSGSIRKGQTHETPPKTPPHTQQTQPPAHVQSPGHVRSRSPSRAQSQSQRYVSPTRSADRISPSLYRERERERVSPPYYPSRGSPGDVQAQAQGQLQGQPQPQPQLQSQFQSQPQVLSHTPPAPNQARTPDRLPVQEENEGEEDVTITAKRSGRTMGHGHTMFPPSQSGMVHRLPTPQFSSSPMIPNETEAGLSSNLQRDGEEYEGTYGREPEHGGEYGEVYEQLDSYEHGEDYEQEHPGTYEYEHHEPEPEPEHEHEHEHDEDGRGGYDYDRAAYVGRHHSAYEGRGQEHEHDGRTSRAENRHLSPSPTQSPVPQYHQNQDQDHDESYTPRSHTAGLPSHSNSLNSLPQKAKSNPVAIVPNHTLPTPPNTSTNSSSSNTNATSLPTSHPNINNINSSASHPTTTHATFDHPPTILPPHLDRVLYNRYSSFRPRTASSDAGGMPSLDAALLKEGVGTQGVQGAGGDQRDREGLQSPVYVSGNGGHDLGSPGLQEYSLPGSPLYGLGVGMGIGYSHISGSGGGGGITQSQIERYERMMSELRGNGQMRPRAPVPPTPSNASSYGYIGHASYAQGQSQEAQPDADPNADPNSPYIQPNSPPPPRATPYPYNSYAYSPDHQLYASLHPNHLYNAHFQGPNANLAHLNYLQNANHNLAHHLQGIPIPTPTPSDSTFSPYPYTPFLRRPMSVSMSMRSSPSHLPVVLPMPVFKGRRGKGKGKKGGASVSSKGAVSKGLLRRQVGVEDLRREIGEAVVRGESTEPRETSSEEEGDGDGDALEDEFEGEVARLEGDEAEGDGSTEKGEGGGVVDGVTGEEEGEEEWVDDEEDEDDLLHLEYHPSFVVNREKRKRRWEMKWEELVKAFQTIDRQTDTTMVLLAAPTHMHTRGTKTMYALRSRSLRRSTTPDLTPLKKAFRTISAARKPPRHPSLVELYNAPEGGEREEELKQALGAALSSLSTLSVIYEGREQRWREEMGRMGEERERVEVLLRQALGMGV